MKSIKQTFALICIALLICENMYMVSAVSTERRSQLRKLKHHKKSATKTIPATFTKEKRIAYGKGIVVGLFLGAVFKLISVGVSTGLKAAFLPDAAGTKAPTVQEFMEKNSNLGKINMVDQLVNGNNLPEKAFTWSAFAPIGVSATTSLVSSVIKAPAAPKEADALMKELSNGEKTDELASEKPVAAITDETVTSVSATEAVTKTADLDQENFQKLVTITADASNQMRKIEEDATVKANDAKQLTNEKGAQEKGEKMASVTYRTIIKNYAANYKQLFMKGSAWTAWKAVGISVLKGVAVAAAITLITIANPVAGLAAAIMWTAYNACKTIYGIYKQVQACRAAVDEKAYETCGSQGIGTGMGIISLIGRRRRHRHQQVKKTKKNKKQIQ